MPQTFASAVPTTTLHLTLLTSHYVGISEIDDGASGSGTAGAAAVHKKDAANAKGGPTPAPKAAGRERETYACRTSAEQLDSVARVLCAALQHRRSVSLASEANDVECCRHRTAAHAQRTQVAKAVRDGAMSWADAAALIGNADAVDESLLHPVEGSSTNGEGQPKMSTSSLVSEVAEWPAAANPTITTASPNAGGAANSSPANASPSVKPASRSSSRGRGSGINSANVTNGASNNNKNTSRNNSSSGGVNRRRTSSGSSRRGSTAASGLQQQQHLTEAETRRRQKFLTTALPPCEVVEVAADGDAPNSPLSPVFFLYHLVNEAEVTAAVSALHGAATLTPVEEAESHTPTEREHRRARASQAAALVTRAVWCTLRPALRAYLHRTGATVAPSHLAVVWAIADPALLEGLNSYASSDAESTPGFVPCTALMPPLVVGAEDGRQAAEHAKVERLVRLLPRSAAYLYDPVAAASATPAFDATLAALQVDRGDSTQAVLAAAESTKAGLRRGSGEGNVKGGAAQRGGSQATSSSTHKPSRAATTAGAAAANNSTNAVAASNSKSRGGAGRSDGPAGTSVSRTAAATATTAAGGAGAGSELLPHALSDSADPSVTAVDFDIEPSAFPYCAVDAAALACYLYAGCDTAAVVDGAAHTAALSRDPRGMALTSFVNKAVAYQRTVLATVATRALVSAKAKSSLCVTAEQLRWVRSFLSASPTTIEKESEARHGATATDTEPHGMQRMITTDIGALGDVARTALLKTGLDGHRWPLPLWNVEAVPLATVPPLPLQQQQQQRMSNSNNGGGDGNTAKGDAAPTLADSNDDGSGTVPAFTAWVAAVMGSSGCDEGQRSEVDVLLDQVERLGSLVSSFTVWTQQDELPRRAARRRVTDKSEREASLAFPHDAYTGGAFTLINGAAALVAEASRSVSRAIPLQTLTALCAAPDTALLPTASESATNSSSLFHRYRNPFQKLANGHDGGGSGVEAAVVPRSLSADAATAGRCAVTTADARESADILLPPYPQEVLAMVRQMVAKNAGHFEVNTTRGTDTITAAVTGPYGGGSGVGGGSAMIDSTMTGSFSPAARQTTLNTTTQSTGLLLRQQQQQQRRRQRGQGGGSSVATALRSFAHGVRLVKEVAKGHLGRRPTAEAAVLLQEALESTLATPPVYPSAAPRLSPSTSSLREKAEKTYVTEVNALELLQRYLSGDSCNPASRCAAAVPSAALRSGDGTLSAANAAAAAAQSLTPRVYEHCLQQVLLHQLLREAGLERLTGDFNSSSSNSNAEQWTVTEQVATESIVPALVNYRERFGAHNVAVAASTLDYSLQAARVMETSPPSALPPPPTSTNRGTKVAAKDADEVHQTSAYAHNAVNVHPTRRVTQLWMVGVALPSRGGSSSQNGAAYRDGVKKSKLENQYPPQRASPAPLPFHRQCTRKWVDMAPRAGTVTSMEVYAAWRALLMQAELEAQTGASPPPENTTKCTSEIGKGLSPALSTPLVYQLLQQYVLRHAEASTSLVVSADSPSPPHFASAASIVSTAPMRFTTHETFYPAGDALMEVWVGEAQRTCRYIKATEVTAALHAGVRSAGMLATPLHLAVRWDDGLLLTCSTTGAQQSSSVPLIDVRLTTSNLVLQRNAQASRLQLRRFANTSSCATAAGVALAHESSGQPILSPPQGSLGEACAQLFEARTTLHCVHDCPTLDVAENDNDDTAAPSAAGRPAELEVTIETSLEEAEVSCEVDEHTGVVHRVFASGTHLLQLPSGATLTRYPIRPTNAAGASNAVKSAAFAVPASALTPTSSPQSQQQQPQQWCETLVTCDGRCFVRRTHEESSSSSASAAAAATSTRSAASTRFRRVVAHGRKSGKHHWQPPAFTQAESTYDAVRHCHVRSRQDGLTVVEYLSLADVPAPANGATSAPATAATGVVVARVVVFPDGTTITSLASRAVRQHVLSGGSGDSSVFAASRAAGNGPAVPAAVALSSPSLCAMLEETEAIEKGLFGTYAGSSSSHAQLPTGSVRWLVEAPTLPRFYLAPAANVSSAASAIVFGDGSVLQRHWVPAAAAAATAQTPALSDTAQAQTQSGGRATVTGGPVLSGQRSMKSADTQLAVEAGSVQQSRATSSTTATTVQNDAAMAAAGLGGEAAAYNGGGFATVLIRPSGSAVRVLHQHAVATVEPADVLASTTRASPAAYAVGQGLPFFDFAYGGGMRLVDAARCVWEVQGLATSSGPKMLYPDHPRPYGELLRELVSAHYSPHRLPRAAELTYADEQRREAAAYAQQRSSGWCPPLQRRLRELTEPYIRTANLLRTDVLAPMEAAAATSAAAVQAGTAIRPVCFGQLANGESIRYWCANDVLPAAAAATTEAGASVSAVANEPHVLQRVVPSSAAGGVLRYACGASCTSTAAEAMALLTSGGRGGADGSALSQRLAEAQRLSLLCVGGLAPLPAPNAAPLTTTYASSLPPLTVLLARGGRWLPPALQPPQQFSSAYSKSVMHAVAAQSDVVWAHDATAAAAAGAASAYIHYMTDRVDAAAAPAVLRAAVARRELRRYEELAQLSHYHRVLTAQWPMEQPNAAREEQVRLELRYDELQRARRPQFAADEKPHFSPTAPKDMNATGRNRQLNSRLVI